VSIYPIEFSAFACGIPICREKRSVFCITRLKNQKSLISMTIQHTNFIKTISGKAQNYDRFK
jgi:hypothetical protein